MQGRTVALTLACSVVVLAALLWRATRPDTTWDGEVTRTVVVAVYVNDNGVLPGARVTFKYPPNDPTGGRKNPDFFDRVIWQGVTGPDGRVTFTQSFGAGGPGKLFGRTRGHFRLSNNIRVEADGFRPFESALELLTGEGTRSISDARPIHIGIVMYRPEKA